jgi:integrase
MPKVNNARQGFLEPEQFAKLRDALPAHLRPMAVVGFHTGARFGELRSIKWEQVDLLGGEIRLTADQTKASRPRTLPIYGDMGPWLELALADREAKYPSCPWLFHYQDRRVGKELCGWRKACRAAGFPDLHFHDLRRSAVRNMERAGIPRHVAMGISGHKTEAIYRRYDIVSSRDLHEAGKRMERYLSGRDRTPEASTPDAIQHTTRTQPPKEPIQ